MLASCRVFAIGLSVVLASCGGGSRPSTPTSPGLDQLLVTPSTGSAEEDWITTFEVSGGTGPYVWSTTGGELRRSGDSSRIVIAASATGSVNLSVRDSDGRSGTARLLVGSRQQKAEVRMLSGNQYDPTRGITGSGNVILVASEPRALITAVVTTTDAGPRRVRVSAYTASSVDTPLQGYQDIEFTGTGIARFVAVGPARGFFLSNLSSDSVFQGSAQFFFTPEGRYDLPPPTLTLVRTVFGGVVRGPNGIQVTSATAEIVAADFAEDLGRRTIANSDGTFRLEVASPGFTVRTSHADFQGVDREFRFPMGTAPCCFLFQLTRR